MKKSISMIAVLAGISAGSGIALGGLHKATYELAENNILKFKKIPAVVSIHETLGGKLDEAQRTTLEESLLQGKRYADTGAKEKLLLFAIDKDGKPQGVALEGFGQGFGGKVGVMAGFHLDSGELLGVGITTMSETPGLGTRVTEPAFTSQFAGMAKDTIVKVKKDGGIIDAVSGATISSRAVAEGVRGARELYEEHRAAIRAALSAPAEVAK